MIDHKMITKGALLAVLSVAGISILGSSANAQVEIFYDQEAKSAGVSSLMSSVAESDVEGVRFFSKSNASSINQRNLGGATALHIACRTNNLEIAQILIDAGADVNIADVEGWTPLMRAALAKDFEIVSLLLSKGAKVNTVNSFNESAIVHAASSDCDACLELLLSKMNRAEKSDIDFVKKQVNAAFIIAKNHDNNIAQDIIATGLDHAIKGTEIVKEDSRFDNYSRNEIGTEKIVDLSLEDKDSINNKDMPLEARNKVPLTQGNVVEKDIPVILTQEEVSEEKQNNSKKFKLTKGLTVINSEPTISKPTEIVEKEKIIEAPVKVKKTKTYSFSRHDDDDFDSHDHSEEKPKSGLLNFFSKKKEKKETVFITPHHDKKIEDGYNRFKDVKKEAAVIRQPQKFKLLVGKK